MNYFNCAKLLKLNNPYRVWQIYNVVYSNNMKAYALRIYGNNYKDALDNAYRHVLENFDASKGELDHYVISVIHKINLSANKHEVHHQELTDAKIDSDSYKLNNGDPLDEIISSESANVDADVDSCIRYMLKYYIEDFKFFKSKKISERVYDYSDIYNKFSTSSLLTAFKIMSESYDAEIEELYILRKKLRFKPYSDDRYLESFDKEVEYKAFFKGIIIYRKLKPKAPKVVYEIDICDLLNRFKKMFYSGLYNRNIGGVECYISLSGKIITDENILDDTIESELIGGILSRCQQMKVMKYNKGESILLTSGAQITRMTIMMLIGDVAFPVEMNMRVSKAVV